MHARLDKVLIYRWRCEPSGQRRCLSTGKSSCTYSARLCIQPIDTEFDMYTSTDGAWFVI